MTKPADRNDEVQLGTDSPTTGAKMALKKCLCFKLRPMRPRVKEKHLGRERDFRTYLQTSDFEVGGVATSNFKHRTSKSERGGGGGMGREGATSNFEGQGVSLLSFFLYEM